MKVESFWKIIRIALTTVYLMVGWIFFTFDFKPSALILGAVFSFLVALVTYEFFIDVQEAERKALLPRIHLLGILLLIVIYDVVVSSLKMIPLLFTLDMKPRVVHLRTRLHSDIARALLANCITLTPGTLTLDLSGDNLLVHWLDAKSTHHRRAGELIKDRLERWLGRIWT